MKLATVRRGGTTSAVRIDGDEAVVLEAPDVRAYLDGQTGETGKRLPVDGLDYAPLIPAPDKVICVGLNYKAHIAESGMETPTHPTLFTKFTSSLVGAYDDVLLPFESDRCDWEAELTIVIGATARRVSVGAAEGHIAGYTIMNDVSVRDWQMRTTQWLQGKSWERSTPLGPWLVTRDESPGPARELVCEIDGEAKQKADTSDLLFGPAELVSYISTFVTLVPGDVIATGTPAGVGMGTEHMLEDGTILVTRIAGLGEQRNVCRRESAS
jgi:acylpyruvate hydrolase